MGVPGISALASALQHVPRLTDLSVDANLAIGDTGAMALFEGLRSVPQLTRLSLSNIGLGIPGVKALSSALHSVPRLDCVLLSYNPAIGDAGAIFLADGLHHVPQLRWLELIHCGLSTGGGVPYESGITFLKDAFQRSCPGCTLKTDGL
jgi:Ran GTPase-activating protein (RanGAP) involved in mRNA processing and transport